MATYGRNRQSIADIEDELNEIFHQHPQSHLNNSEEPVIPADCLVDIFRAFSESYHGVELMTNQELDMLKQLLVSNPGLEVTPQMLLQFIAMRTTHSPRNSPHGSPTEEETDLPGRGRTADRDAYDPHSRSSSNDSSGTSVYRPSSRQSSAGPPVPPKTPTSRNGPSPFDTSKRQRSIPLGNNAPSSWTKRPAPANRRKSDASSHGRALSDSESSFSTSPTSFGRTPGRTRAPSNPTTPASHSHPNLSSSISPGNSVIIGSPPLSRPHSRTKSLGYHYASPDRDSPSRILSPPPDHDHANPMYDYHQQDDGSFTNRISSLQMPSSSADSDSDQEDSALGLVLDRSATSSTVSLEPMDRLDVLQRANTELGRKLMDAERTLQNKLEDHEIELEEMQGRLEEAKSELSAMKREEKELRSKERTNSTQIAALESDVAKLQKSLENARISYHSLQKQYQEQCAESERNRNTLRRRDQETKDLQDSTSLQALEITKLQKEKVALEDRIAQLEEELSVTQNASAQLDQQKQVNQGMQETISRMYSEIQAMSDSAASNHAQGGSSGSSSAQNSLSKSLGAELKGKMGGKPWGMEDDETEVEEGDSEETSVEVTHEDDDTEGEDVIQTIITRKKRKVASRANRIEMLSFEEVKEYSDAYTQHEVSDFTASSTTQTDPEPKVLTASFSVQTDENVVETIAIQTEPEPQPIPRVTVDMETQTDNLESEPSRSPSPQTTLEEDEAMASSSSTVLPPTPKASPIAHPHPHPGELPPAYTQINDQDRDSSALKIAAETLKQWHNGVEIPIEPIAGGVSEDVLEEWKALKKELGIECKVIEKVLASSERTGRPRPSKDGKLASSRRSRFYNIYNTYVYGNKDGESLFPHGAVTHLLLCVGASAAVFLAMTPYMMPQYNVPGGPTYYDRAAWSSFNGMQPTGEGFAPDGTAAVWNVLGRVGGGAARIVQGWPT